MCGICGKLAFDPQDRVEPALVERMMDAIRHRGPDDAGMFDGGSVILGHRRLSIIDLNTGHQPITNEDGTVTIVYNGEVYNFRELRDWLVQRGHTFKTLSDTEVIVHLYEECGDECVSRLQGMFAFALWDATRRRLLLARDRVGIKPLYYAATADGVVFASEIKSLLVEPGVRREVDPRAIDAFLSYLYIPGELTMFPQVKKLEPGHYLTVEGKQIKTAQYWDLSFEPTSLSLDAATEQLRALLAESVRMHMIADVPVGVLLSGGVDSTGVLSFATEETGRPVHAFTVGFEGERFADERPYARLAAAKYGAVMHELTISADEFRDFLPRYVWHMEEPVCEPPAVALYYVSRLASRHVKVLLSGEGGDEAFAGYQNYRNLVWMERFKRAGTGWSNAATAMALRNMPGPLKRLRKYALPMRTPMADYYFSRTAGPQSPFTRMRHELLTPEFRRHLNGNVPHALTRELFARMAGASTLNQMLYVDTKTWLPDDLLVKADKMTMANSVELRVPLLDHKVLEFAASLPENYKVRGFTTKYILKRALEGRVPKAILDRPKTGFPVPFASWMRNELRDFVGDTLTDSRTRGRGYFDPSAIDKLLSPQGGADESVTFSLLVLELWHRQFLEAQPA